MSVFFPHSLSAMCNIQSWQSPLFFLTFFPPLFYTSFFPSFFHPFFCRSLISFSPFPLPAFLFFFLLFFFCLPPHSLSSFFSSFSSLFFLLSPTFSPLFFLPLSPVFLSLYSPFILFSWFLPPFPLLFLLVFFFPSLLIYVCTSPLCQGACYKL